MRKRSWWLGLGLAFVWAVFGKASVGWARDDFQSWNTVEMSKRLNESWDIFTFVNFRLRGDAGELFYHEYRQGIRWQPSPYLRLGLNYLFARNESSGKPLEEHRGELDITPQARLGSMKLSMRGRIELRTIEGSAGEQEWRFRVMPKVAYPVRLGGYTVTPYVADDLFYDSTRDAWNQNRVYLGVALPVRGPLGADPTVSVYYMLQSQRSVRDDWSSNHIVGTKLSVRF